MNPFNIIHHLGTPEHEHIGTSICLGYPFGFIDWERYESLRYTLFLDEENSEEKIIDFLKDLKELIHKHELKGLIV